jgi:hypothetical protein
MAWLETDRHGRLRIGSKYYDGLKCREPLGVQANKQTIAEARRLCATIQLELKARTFDYAKRFPDSDRIKQRGKDAERSTLGAVNGVKKRIPDIEAVAPKGMNVKLT